MVNSTESTVPRMAGDERRKQLLEVAMHLFSKNGFTGTTTKNVAEMAGVSEAMVFKHFANKDELYTAILDHKACSQGLENPFADVAEELEAKNDFGVFSGIALKALNHHDEDRDFMRLLLHAALENHELSRMFFESFVKGFYEFLGNYISRRQKDGAFREVNPQVVVRAFVGMIIHHSMNKTLWDTGNTILKISNEDAAREFSKILLKGILSPAEQAEQNGN